MTKISTLFVIKKLKEKIFDLNFLESNKTNSKAFTRKRKLPFSHLILFMVNMIKQTLQKELTNFIQIFSSNNIENITKSAFSQSRMNLKPEAFIELNQLLISEFYKNEKYKLWNNYRLLAIDGSTMNLPKSKEILNSFKIKNRGIEYSLARISTLYDLLNGMILDSQFNNFNTGEHSLAIEHIKHTQKNDLIIADRGYGNIWLFYYFLHNNIDFVIRLKKSFIREVNSFLESNETSKIIEVKKCPRDSEIRLDKFNIEFKSFKFRVVKVELDNGEIEIIGTSLLDEEKFPNEIFKDLYFIRWGIEVNYNHLKNNIGIENFSGKSILSVKQDFFANLFVSNIQSLFVNDAQEELEKKNKDKKYNYKINRNLSLGYLKYKIIEIFLGENEDENYEKLKKLFQLEPVPIRNGRKYPRNINKGRKFHSNIKRSI